MVARTMPTPVGRVPIREAVAAELHGMTDIDVANRALRNGTSLIDPEAYAELCARGLSGPGMSEADTFSFIEQRR